MKNKRFDTSLRIVISLFITSIFLIITNVAIPIITPGILALIGLITYCFRFGFKENKKFLDYVKLLLAISVGVYTVTAIMHWPSLVLDKPIAIISSLVWLYMEGFDRFNQEINGSDKISKNLFFAAIVFMLLGVLFKIMHWPGGEQSIWVSAVLIVAWLLKKPISEFRKR